MGKNRLATLLGSVGRYWDQTVVECMELKVGEGLSLRLTVHKMLKEEALCMALGLH
jgi:hypothetical protein